MKKYFIALFLLVFTVCFYSQSIFINESSRLHKLDINTCTSTLLGTMSYVNGTNTSSVSGADVAFLPNGKLYVIDGNNLFEVDTNTASPTLLFSHGISSPSGFVGDASGNLYISNATNLYQVDVLTSTVTNLGALPCGSAGDMFFNQGELYLTCLNFDLLKVNITNPSASTVQGSLGYYSFASFTMLQSCAPPVSYVFNSYPNTDILTVNPTNGTSSVFCSTSLYADGATTMAEFNLPSGSVNAGADTTWSICSSQSYDFDTMLTLNANPGGTWVDAGNFIVMMPVTISSTQTYKYIVGSTGCYDTAYYTVQYNAGGASAGVDTLWSICGSETYDLDTMLTSGATTGGFWYDNTYNSQSMPVTVSSNSVFHYVVGSGACSDTSDYTIQVSSSSNAGIDTLWSICGSETYDLDTMLTVSAATGGLWYDNAYNSQSMPVTVSSNSVFHYIVGSGACSDTSDYTIQVNSSSNAGIDTLWSICGSETYDLDTMLTASATTGGFWYDNAYNSQSIPVTVSSNSVFHYVVGSGACSDTSDYTIQVNLSSNAGIDTLWSICGSETYDLDTMLTSSASTGGLWYDNVYSSQSMPVTVSSNSTFYYVVGSGSCFDTAVYTIQLTLNGSAGNDTAFNVCNASTINLNNHLTSTANMGGNWHDNSYAATSMPVLISSNSIFHYVVGATGCLDTANYTLTAVTPPSAGVDTMWNACSSANYNLDTMLTSSATAGGSWYNNSYVLQSMPVTISSNSLFYYITSSSNCSDTSLYTVNIISPLNAGNDTSWNICQPNNYNLNNHLTNNAVTGGGWYDNNFGVITMPVNVLTDTLFYYITDNGNCSDTALYSIQVVPLNVYAGLDTNLTLCNSNSINLFAYLRGNPTSGGNWYNSNNNAVVMPFDPYQDSYMYVVGANQCYDTSYVNVSIQDVTVNFNVSPTKIFTSETVVNFTNTSINALSYEWKIDGISISNYPNYSYVFNNPGTHEICLIANNTYCLDSLCTEVEVFDKSYIYIPSSFTPNGDGFNEKFGPHINTNLVHYEFYVFNRWGEVIFETQLQNQFWDGTYKGDIVPVGAYAWRLKYRKAEDIEIKSMSGHVVVIK